MKLYLKQYLTKFVKIVVKNTVISVNLSSGIVNPGLHSSPAALGPAVLHLMGPSLVDVG